MTGVYDDQVRERVRRMLDGADQRTRDLLLWGTWSDGRHQPCECCGTSIVVMESIRHRTDLTNTYKRWVEIIDGSVEQGILSVIAMLHTPQRCQEIRQERAGG